jgi:hypothetical protein
MHLLHCKVGVSRINCADFEELHPATTAVLIHECDETASIYLDLKKRGESDFL